MRSGAYGWPRVFIADVFDEKDDQHIILVLAGIHAATQHIAGLPEEECSSDFFSAMGSDCQLF
jgi:hypothetical protein